MARTKGIPIAIFIAVNQFMPSLLLEGGDAKPESNLN